MPAILYRPTDRRSFLKISALAGAAWAVNGCVSLNKGAADAKELHLALLSDTHVPGDRINGSRGFNPWENLQRIVPDVVAARPEGVILNGDAARLEGKPEDYREVKALLQPVAAVAPVYISLGNHDDRQNLFQAFADRPGAKQPVEGKHVVVLEHDVARILILDSLLYTNKTAGLLGPNQRRWLETYLPTITDRPVVLFVHHTLGEGEGELLDVDRLFALLRSHPQVKAIFYGHSHVWELGARGPVKLVNLPAVGYNFRDQDPVGWVDARFQRSGVELTLRAIGGNRSGDGKTSAIRWA